MSTLARRSLLNFVGGVAFGFLSFAWLVVVTRGWGASRSGVLLEAVAFFTIAAALVGLGSEESVLRAVSRGRSLGMPAATRRTMLVALVPILLFSIAVGVAVWLAAPRLAVLFLLRNDLADREALARYMRLFAPVLPFTAMYFAVLAATRGFGTMMPTVAIERVGRTLAQVLLAGLVIVAGWGVTAMALAWELPFVVGLIFASVELAKLIRRDDRTAQDRQPIPSLTAMAAEFWRFSGLRGLASVFQVTSLWIDTLLVGTLITAASTAIYTTSSRTVRLGSVVLLALIQAMAPQISDLFTKKETRRAEHVYRTSTWWTMTVTWPLYLILAIFAPVLLRVFGHHFSGGAQVVVTMSAAMLFSTAIGPVDMVLLMGGKSGWNLVNSTVSLAADVVLIVVLVPHLGIEGAAIAWAVSIALKNVMPWLEVRSLLGVTPFAAPGLIPAVTSVASFGVVGIVARIGLGATLPSLVLAVALGTLSYVLLLRRFGGSLEFASFFSAVRVRVGRS
jgi:O-antigen/teichoic acid export membrane protein